MSPTLTDANAAARDPRAADLKFLQRLLRVRARNFKSKSGTGYISLLVLLFFRI
jgi:hypothetical protein